MESFKNVLLRARTVPVLTLPNPKWPYYVDRDACNTMVGPVLFQTNEDEVGHPIGYGSGSLILAEKYYSTSERECLAIAWDGQTSRPYPQGSKFVVNTDHLALQWLMSIVRSSGRLMRWRLRLLKLDFDIAYIKGIGNCRPKLFPVFLL